MLFRLWSGYAAGEWVWRIVQGEGRFKRREDWCDCKWSNAACVRGNTGYKTHTQFLSVFWAAVPSTLVQQLSVPCTSEAGEKHWSRKDGQKMRHWHKHKLQRYILVCKAVSESLSEKNPVLQEAPMTQTSWIYQLACPGLQDNCKLHTNNPLLCVALGQFWAECLIQGLFLLL